jgi:hypothetical protein
MTETRPNGVYWILDKIEEKATIAMWSERREAWRLHGKKEWLPAKRLTELNYEVGEPISLVVDTVTETAA